jgi:beta-glucanase (GH16 family)
VAVPSTPLRSSLLAFALLVVLALGHPAAAAANLVWGDEFNGPGGSAPDPSRWTAETGAGGWGNQELEYYTGRPANAALNGHGELAITARREAYGGADYTSARLTTAASFARAYGRFEARIELPRGQGLWPAFWLLGSDVGTAGWPGSGEIDVMENVGNQPNTSYSTIHGPGFSGSGGLSWGRWLPAPLADAYHTVAVDWSPNRIRFLLDGVEFRRLSPASLPAGDAWVFDHPFFMILDLAVGGSWPGSPDATTAFPQTMLVDYVRVYDDAPEPDLARGRTVWASSSERADLPPQAAVDGDSRTRWSSAFADGQWLAVNLGRRVAVSRVRLAWEAAYAADYRIELSDDALHWRTAATVTGSDGATDDVAVTGTGRYVRVVGTRRATPYGMSLYDLEVAGTPVSAPPGPPPPQGASAPKPAPAVAPRLRVPGSILRLTRDGRSNLLASCARTAGRRCAASVAVTTRARPHRTLATARIVRTPGAAPRAVRFALRGRLLRQAARGRVISARLDGARVRVRVVAAR